MPANPNQAMPLRAVADLLVQHRVATKTDKYGFQSLLSLLKAGDIQGVVLFPEISRDPIPVPKSYWMPLGPEALEPLRRIPRRRLTGTYKIKLRDIAPEVVRVAFDRRERRIGSDFEQLATRLIKEADQEASVDVLESDWIRFRSALPGSPSAADEKAKVTGRPAKDWEAVYIELIAILLFTLEKHDLGIESKILAGQAVSNLRGQGWLDIPDESTIRGRFSIIGKRVKALKDQHRPLNH
jgi:hypothetical protein